MHIGLSLLLVVLFLAMNAFFVIAEFALVRVRKSENVNAYLSACQLGITLASLALGWLGEPAFSALIRPLFELLHLPEAFISIVAVAIGYFIMTTLHVVVGELIPKSFAIFATERYALFTAGPLMAFYKITYPIMILFNGITNGVVRLAGHDPANEHEVYTGDEIKLLIDESTESGLIDPEQNTFVDNIFDLGDKDAEAIMTPRTDLVCIDLEDTFEENMALVTQYKYTRYPVCRESKDRIVGFVHVKDLYLMQKGSTIDDLPVRTIEAVPESIPVAKLLQVLQEGNTKIAVVVDEHGGTAGIVTMTDIVEQIVGHVDDEYRHADNDSVKKLTDDTMMIDGGMSVGDFEELIGFTPEDAEDCETLGGLIMDVLDRIPAEGDSLTLEGREATAKLTVMQMDRHRIDAVKLVLTPKLQQEDEE